MRSMTATWAAVHGLRMRRHFLATGENPSAGAIAERVGGLQAQVASGPVLSVAARGGTGDVSALVRMWTLRGTVHLVREQDVSVYAVALGPNTAARETRLWPKQGVPATAEDAVADAILEVLSSGPLDRRTIAREVGERLGPAYRVLLEHPWGIGFKPAIARGLVRMEGSGADVCFRRPDAPLAEVAKTEAQQRLARTYLTANIAGDAASFAAWTGLSRAEARAAIAAVAETELTIDGHPYRAVGWEPDADLPPGRVNLPAFDPYTLAVVDKYGFCPAEMQPRIWRKGGWVAPIIVEKGLPIGIWNPKAERKDLA